MSVRAKFKVDQISAMEGGSRIDLSAVMNGSPENEEFFKYTPSGKIQLSTVNPNAVAQFREGQEFYVDFTPVEPTPVT